MHEAGLGIIRLARGRTFEAFGADFELLDSAERAVSIIGRSARNVSARTRNAQTGVDWRRFIGMAKLLEDTDDALEPAELWDAVQSVPAMVRAVAAMLPPMDDDLPA